MVKQILKEAGFIQNETFRELRFLRPPKTTYAVWLESFSRRGSDDRNRITEHEYTIELYSYQIDIDAEKRIENVLDYHSIPYSKNERYWIESEQLYQVVYTFDFIDKE